MPDLVMTQQKMNVKRQISAIISHHCGDNLLCKIPKFCTYIQIQNKHKHWTTDQIQLAAATKSNCHGGQSMQLSDEVEKTISNSYNMIQPEKID